MKREEAGKGFKKGMTLADYVKLPEDVPQREDCSATPDFGGNSQIMEAPVPPPVPQPVVLRRKVEFQKQPSRLPVLKLNTERRCEDNYHSIGKQIFRKGKQFDRRNSLSKKERLGLELVVAGVRY